MCSARYSQAEWKFNAVIRDGQVINSLDSYPDERKLQCAVSSPVQAGQKLIKLQGGT